MNNYINTNHSDLNFSQRSFLVKYYITTKNISFLLTARTRLLTSGQCGPACNAFAATPRTLQTYNWRKVSIENLPFDMTEGDLH